MQQLENQIQKCYDIGALINAAQELHLSQSGIGNFNPRPINRPTLEMLTHFFEILHSGESKVLLQWPMYQGDVTMIHPLAMLSSFAPRNIQVRKGLRVCDPLYSFRTLFFPWGTGRNRALQKSHLVRRQEVLKWNGLHLSRSNLVTKSTAEENDDEIMQLHVTIGHLHTLESRDEIKPHLTHPSLAEIYPMFILDVDEVTDKPKLLKVGQMFERLDFGASLNRQKDYRPELENPCNSPFGFFGVSTKNEMRRVLAAEEISRNTPDICILDLSLNSVNRLGQDWIDVVRDFLKECKKRFQTMPFYAITNDTYVQQTVTKLLSVVKGSACIRKSIIVRFSGNPIADDPELNVKSKIRSEFKVVSGDVTNTIGLLSDTARALKNSGTVRSIFRCIAIVRAAASLPYGMSEAYGTLLNSFNRTRVEAFLENKSCATAISQLEAVLDCEISGKQRTKVNDVLKLVKLLFQKLENESPIGSLLESLVEKLDLDTYRTIIVFNSEYSEHLGTHRFRNNQNHGEKFNELLETGFLKCVNDQSLIPLLRDLGNSSSRSDWNRIIIVAPSLKWLSEFITQPWLPQNVFILCERYYALRVAREYERLLKFEELSGQEMLIERFKEIFESANSEFTDRESEVLNIELNAVHKIDKLEKVIDLTDDEQDKDTELVVISLESGRTLKARPATRLIRINQSVETEHLEKISAEDVQQHDIIVIPDSNFLDQAREILPIEILVRDLVDYYHKQIEIKLQIIPGDSITEKARYIYGAIQSKGATTKNEATVRNWIDVEKHQQIDPEERKSNAPQNWQTFSAFMSVLEEDPNIVQSIWERGIQPFRADRRRAGQKMANAFVSIIIDPHGTAFKFPEEVRKKIFQLQENVLECTDQVAEIRVREH